MNRDYLEIPNFDSRRFQQPIRLGAMSAGHFEWSMLRFDQGTINFGSRDHLWVPASSTYTAHAALRMNYAACDELHAATGFFCVCLFTAYIDTKLMEQIEILWHFSSGAYDFD